MRTAWIGAALAAVMWVPAAWAGDDLPLEKKAALLDHDLQARFADAGQVRCKLRLPTADRPFVSFNQPDNAYMTGMYTATLAMRYAVTQDPAVRAQAGESLDALHLLCTVSGKPGLLARAAVRIGEDWYDDGIWRESADGQYRWRGDVSSDQMDGVLFGLAVAYDLVADDAQKARIAADAAALVDHVLNNGRRIIGYDGEPTQWGNYTPEYVGGREPMNALLLLQHVKVAHHVTGEARFAEAYAQLVEEGYADLAVKARRLADPRRINHSDDVLLFLAYLPLLEYETDPGLRNKYLESLRRFWSGDDRYPGVAPENNPIYTWLAKKYLDPDINAAPALEWLDRFPLDGKWNRTVIDAYAAEFGFAFDPAPESADVAEGVVPIDRRPPSWSYLVGNPYRGGDRTAPLDTEYNGHDYLLGYWLGQWWGYIPAGG